MTDLSPCPDMEFGLFAVRYGGVSNEQLDQALIAWNQDRTRKLASILVESGAVSDEELKELQASFQKFRGLPPDRLSESTGEESSEVDNRKASQPNSLESPELSNGGDRRAAFFAPQRFSEKRFHAQGGLGQVYCARDQQINRDVALKEIRGEFAEDANGRARFLREAEITGRLEHPGIVPVYALGAYPDGRPYYAMRFVKGDTLLCAIKRHHEKKNGNAIRQSLSLRALLGRFCDVCDAIHYAHRRGVVHRDIKPSNIMLGEYGETLVVDWGLAKVASQDEAQAAQDSMLANEDAPVPDVGDSSATRMGAAIGSPAFMSPEQARGDNERVSFPADIYGLGATLSVILTGQNVVPGDSPETIMANVRRGEIVAPRSKNAAVSKSLNAICLKALAMEPEDRYETAKALREDVERFLADEPVLARNESWLEKMSRTLRRRKALLPAILTGLSALVLLAIIKVNFDRKEKITLRESVKANELVLDALNSFSRIVRESHPEHRGQRFEEVAQKIAASNVPDTSKAEVYDALVDLNGLYQSPKLATDLARLSVAISIAEFGEFDPLTLQRKRQLASMLYVDGDYQGAEDLWREVMEQSVIIDPKLSHDAGHDVASLLMSLGREGEAEPLIKKTIKFREATLEKGHPDIARSKFVLGQIYSRTNRREEALEQLKQAARTVEAAKRSFGPSERLSILSNVPLELLRAERFKESLGEYKALLPEYIQLLGIDHPNTITVEFCIGSAERELGHFDQSLERIRRVITDRKRILGDDHPHVWHAQIGLALTHLALLEYPEAHRVAEPALQRYLADYGFGHKNSYMGSRLCAFALIEMQRFEAADAVVRRWREAQPSTLPDINCDAILAAGEVALGLNDFDEALRLAQQLATNSKATAAQRGAALSLIGATKTAMKDYDDAQQTLMEAVELLGGEGHRYPHQRHWLDKARSRMRVIEEAKQNAAPAAD